MQKRVLAAFVVAAVMGPASAASAGTGSMIFHNNSSSQWRLKSLPTVESQNHWYWRHFPEGYDTPIEPGGLSFGSFEYIESDSYTIYSATWEDVSDGTSCTFESWAVKNSYGNVRFSYVISNRAGPRASTVKCTGRVPTTTNGTGNYQFDHYVSY